MEMHVSQAERLHFLEAALASVGDGVTVVDAQGRLVFQNEAGRRMARQTISPGSSAPEQAGLLELRYPSGQPVPPSETPLARALRGQTVPELDLIQDGPDGTNTFLRVRGSPILDADSRVLGAVSVCRDVTEQRRIKEEVRQHARISRLFTEHSLDGVVIADESGNVVEWSRGEEQITGLTRDEMLGKPIWEAQHRVALPEEQTPERYAQHRAFILRMLASEEVPQLGQVIERPIQRPDGTRRTIQVLAFSVKTERGLMLGGVSRDVTERKQAEYALRESEATLRGILSAMSDGVTLVDRDGRILDCNDAALRMFGATRDEIVGTDVYDHVVPEDREWARSRAGVVLEQGFARSEVGVLRKNGGSFDAEIGVSLLLDASGWPRAFVGVTRDVTERKRAEEERERLLEALRQSEERYRLLFAQMAAGSVLFDVVSDVAGQPCDFRFVDVNPALERILGLSREQAIGRTVNELDPTTAPDWIEAGMHCALTGETITLDGYVPLLDKHLSVSIYCPNPSQVAATVIDVSDRERLLETLRASEEWFRGLVETTSDWVWEVDENLVYTYASPRVRDLLGYEPSEVLGRAPFDLMPEEEGRRLTPIVTSAVAERRSFTSLENTNRHKDGRLVILETSGVPFFEPDGTLRGYRGIDRDITERKRAEAAVRDSEQRFRSLIDHSLDVIIMSSPDGRVFAANPAATEVFGWTEEEFRRLGEAGLVDESDNRFRSYLEERERTGKARAELRYRRKDGSRFEGEVTSIVFQDSAGEPRTATVVRDVSERKAAEAVLSRYELLSRHARDIVLFVRHDGRILEANESAVQAYGYAREELLSLTIFDLRVLETQPSTRSQMAQADSEGILFETVHQRKDGTTFAVEVSSLGAEIGGERVLLSIIRDITERKRAEEARSRLAAIVESSGDAILSLSPDGVITTWNRGAEVVYGYTPEEAIGQSVAMIVPPDLADEYAASMASLLQGRSLPLRRTVRMGEDGRRVDVEISASPMRDAAGCVIGVAGIHRDVTERKRNEDLLHLVVASSPDTVLLLDRGLRCTWVANPIPPFTADRVVGQWLPDLLRPEDAGEIEEECRRVLASGVGGERDLTLWIDGVKRWFDVAVQPWRDGAGSVVGLGIYLHETTERRRAEESLRASESSLAHLEERHRIAMDLHDEYIQAMYAVVLRLHCLKQAAGGEGTPIRESLHQVQAEVATVVERMRGYIRALRSGVVPQPGLRPALEALVEELRLGGAARVDLAIDCDDRSIVGAEAVPDLLSIVREAASNSIRHGGARVVTIRLGVADGRLALTIRDDGRGFNPRAVAPAAGRGLHNMRERARALRGRLTVSSQPGHGAEIRLEIPLRGAPSADR